MSDSYTEPTFSDQLDQSQESLAKLIKYPFLIKEGKLIFCVEEIAKIVDIRLSLFSSQQQQGLSVLYDKLQTISKQLKNKLEAIKSVAQLIFESPVKNAAYVSKLENEAKSLLIEAINLNKTSIENCKIASLEEINYITALDYIKQIHQFLQDNFTSQIEFHEKGYTLDLTEDPNSDEAKYFDITQSLEYSPDQKFNIDLIHPTSIDLSRTTVGYADDEKGMEINISIGEGYQAFTLSWEEEGLESEVEISSENMLKAVLVIARELNIPLNLLT